MLAVMFWSAPLSFYAVGVALSVEEALRVVLLEVLWRVSLEFKAVRTALSVRLVEFEGVPVSETVAFKVLL